MSDVLIKGMEMPECCNECPLLLAYGSRLEDKTIYHCTGRVPEDSRFSDDADLTKRPKEGCPLVEVSPHGRLIDADKLLNDFSECEMKAYGYNGSCDDCEDRNICRIRVLRKDIEDAPTVLEATKTDNKKKYSCGYPYPSETAPSYSMTMEASE